MTTTPCVARLGPSPRPSQQTIPKASNAAPATRATTSYSRCFSCAVCLRQRCKGNDTDLAGACGINSAVADEEL
jgi:hypothetical protein